MSAVSGRKASKRQLEVLELVEAPPGAIGCEWGDAWSRYGVGRAYSETEGALAFRNFDRVCKSLTDRGLVTDGDGEVLITDLGREVLRTGRLP